MAEKGPGRSHRQGLTLIQLLTMFPDDATSETWFEVQRWSEGRYCPDCGSVNTVPIASRKPMPYRCRDCRGHFSVRKGTVMQSSRFGLQKWAIALYMMTTGIKGTTSMKVYRGLGMRQATAWHLMHRIRDGFIEGEGLPFPGPVEVDETYIGSKRKNMPKPKRAGFTGRGGVGKAVVTGAKDRTSKRVSASVVQATDKATLQGFVADRVAPGATVYTDEHGAYRGLPFTYETANHSVGEYVSNQAHVNGMESLGSLLKRGYHGTFHHLSEKHLGRYVTEFAGRHNIRNFDTIEQMGALAHGMADKRLRYRDLVSDKRQTQ